MSVNVLPDRRTTNTTTPAATPPSRRGLSFQSHQAFPIETTLWIRIRMGAKTCQFKGIVRRAGTQMLSGRRSYISGIQFVRSHQTTHAQAIVAGYFDTCRRRMIDRKVASA